MSDPPRGPARFVVFCIIAALCWFYPFGHCRADGVLPARFIVSGHILNKTVEVGVHEGFVRKAIPFINAAGADFLVLTGDMVYGGRDAGHRFPLETIRAQYDFIDRQVFGKINTKIYCVAGNHDTGWTPHPPSVRLFQEKWNRLQFAFEYRRSLFIVLSQYRPFCQLRGLLSPGIFENYDTPESRALLEYLRGVCRGCYRHIFIFTHFSPVNDFASGYYWSNFLIPFLSTLKQDVHVFSTDHLMRGSLIDNAAHVVRYNRIRFYSFAQYPRCTYVVQCDDDGVRVELRQGPGFLPVPAREVAYRPASRVSLLKRYLRVVLADGPRWAWARMQAR